MSCGFPGSGNVTRPAPASAPVDSVASNNHSFGVEAFSTSVGRATAVMGNVVARVAHSVVTGNVLGVDANGGTIFSYGDNDIDGNTNNNTAVLTPLAKH